MSNVPIHEPSRLKTTPSRNGQDLLAPCIALCLGVLAYGLAAPRIGWTSDDYALVFSCPLNPHPPIGQALRMGGFGHLSPARLLNYPFVGFVGAALGAAGAHVLALLIHLAIGVALYALLRRLTWTPVLAAFAAALFLVPPWVAQPVVWWSASPVALCTLLVVVSLHAYLSWMRCNSIARWLWLAAAIAGAFLSELVYEAWLGGYLAFVALDWYAQGDPPRIDRRHFSLAILRSLPMLIPYAAWFVWFKLADNGIAHPPHYSPVRMAIVFFSVQLRTAQWPLDIHWRAALSAAMSELNTIPAIAMMLVTIALLAICVRYRREAALTEKKPLLPVLVFAWGVFMAARIAFVLQGGISLNTRHNYGGAIGFSIAVAAVVDWIYGQIRSSAGKTALVILCGVITVSLVLGSMGTAAYWATFTQAEQATIRSAVAAVQNRGPQTRAVLVIGSPCPVVDPSFRYFSEAGGGWLDTMLAALVPGSSAYVIPTESASRDDSAILAIRTGWPPNYAHDFGLPQAVEDSPAPATTPAGDVLLSPDSAAVFAWSQGRLQRINPK